MWKKGNINGMSEEMLEEKRQQQKIFITKELDELCVAKENKHVKTYWQIEKEQRIKPSLWWKEVSKAQVSQIESGSQTDNHRPKTNQPINRRQSLVYSPSSNGGLFCRKRCSF